MAKQLEQTQKTNNSLIENFIIGLFNEFQNIKVDYCVLRNYEYLPKEHGNDIDILVKKNDLKKAENCIRHFADKLDLRFLAIIKVFGLKKYYLFNDRLDSVLIIDLFTNISWKGLIFNSSSYILSNKIQLNDIWVASKGCDGAVTCLKELLMFGIIKKRNNALQHINQCAVQDQNNFINSMKPYLGQRLSERVHHQVINKQWMVIEKNHKKLRWALIWRSLVKNSILQFFRWFIFFWLHLIHRIKIPIGFFIVLLGPDGSGKTTINRELANKWHQNFSKKSVNIHGDFKILPQLKIIRCLYAMIIGKKIKPDIDFTQRHSGVSVKPHSPIKSFVYLTYYIWDYFLGHISIFFNKGKDRLIVADRYFYDYFFQLRNSRVPKEILCFFHFFIPKPDLIIYLDRDPEQIYLMKDELTIEEIQRQQKILRELVNTLPKAITINANNGVNATVENVMVQIHNKMSLRTLSCK